MAATAAVLLLLPRVHAATVLWPPILVAVADLLLLSAPLIAAVILAVRVSGDRFAPATGLRGFSWIDIAAGIGVGLLARALVELAAPTAGGLGAGLGAGLGGAEEAGVVAATVVALAGAVLVTPFIEELFFRGLLQRALADALTDAGPAVAGVVAVLVSTAAFTALHVVAAGSVVGVGLVLGTVAVGLGCGILSLLTGRLGGAITAHIVYNAIGVALLL
ncbi:hypothetical protein B1729_09985 [Microbacterium sp. B35-04]|uniref:CPBP family intramembrane glutamic endopeptidase n=1 Tax=Microbacterium sp. B35-04 TaxID=1961716 RepID=UPI0013D1800C|nr:CPBP family intramembrane glutamic endopeptidase [Microbacterium sp. B35-04]KAF2413440.1 hypothetical protein B1729_09985 [Microbacterium sp. B35-04]